MAYTKTVKIKKIDDQVIESIEDAVVVEYPFTIFLNGEEFITLLCSPSGLEYLVVGFLVSEGIIKSKKDIEKITIDEEKGHAHVSLANNTNFVEKLFGKRTVTTGCGKGTVFYNVLDSLGTHPIESSLKVKAQSILSLSNKLNKSSVLFKETGGVHSCGLCNQEEIIIFHEDVGRHNALDKIVGEAFLKEINLEDKILITSGRISSEMIIKTAKQKIPILVSRSAPTDLSVGIAKELGITLIGFARGKRMNIYQGEERIIAPIRMTNYGLS
ncbi:formate dehydrogenase family accessory protein FdhD [Clostridium aceticum]|uniref:Sulfur carrier protein FdhD n=1 Tax=Clostridium aceticum TaxID=84022 RepID=A0A0D8IBZ2_9CLOT|nr:formate dehydrogenase accessory sulfurtransferase FdhD [Clostridium aceticum]AKL95710.1 formate dehydrogenase family accessory protein FdhD [Clostridium aceticum]KJF26736.1 formate dehydrogenase [Clostridium aceticum]